MVCTQKPMMVQFEGVGRVGNKRRNRSNIRVYTFTFRLPPLFIVSVKRWRRFPRDIFLRPACALKRAGGSAGGGEGHGQTAGGAASLRFLRHQRRRHGGRRRAHRRVRGPAEAGLREAHDEEAAAQAVEGGSERENFRHAGRRPVADGGTYYRADGRGGGYIISECIGG